MGTCYSKSGQDVNPDQEKRPKEKKRGSQKNGYTGSFKSPMSLMDIPIQKDLSDTVYTEDSHFCFTDAENCMNKSMQTSLNNLTRDANKNIENLTGCEIIEQNDCVVISDAKEKKTDIPDSAQELEEETVKQLELMKDSKVSTSDSGIVVEGCKSYEGVNQSSEITDEYSENFETHLDSLQESKESTVQSQCSYNYIGTKYCGSRRNQVLTEHSNSCICSEGDNRESVASVDRLSESYRSVESCTDLDKIRLAIRQNSLGSPSENRMSLFDGSENSYDLSSAISQPEVTTMMMNGREVVVIDVELFSHIIDEIQNLKMKLSQLTEVIQDDDEDVLEKSAALSILSSSA